MSNSKTYVLDTWKMKPLTINTKQLDSDRTIVFNLQANGVNINLTGKTVKYYIEKPDGTEVYNNCTISDALGGMVQCSLTEQSLAVAGTAKMELQIIGTGGNESTFTVYLIITETIVNNSAIESSNEYNALITGLSDINSVKSQLADITSIPTTLSGTIQGKITLKPNTTYILTGDVTIGDNTLIEGKGATIKGDTYSLICGSNVEIRNCNFQVLTPRATGTTLLNQQAVTVVFKNGSNGTIKNCTGDGLVIAFDNYSNFLAESNIYKGGHSYTSTYRRSSLQAINGSSNGVIRKNTVSYSTGDGLHEDSSNFITFEDNESYSNGMTGFFTAYGGNIKFYRNKAHDHTPYDGFDLNFAADTGLMSDVRNAEIIGNTSYNNNGYGIYLTCSNAILKNNIIHNNGSNGIRINGRSGDSSYAKAVDMENNIVYDNNANNNADGTGNGHNITGVNLDSCIISNNIVYQTTGHVDKCIYISGRNNKVALNNAYKTGSATSSSTDLIQVVTDSGYYNSVFGNNGVNNRPRRNSISAFTNSWVNLGTAGAAAYYSLSDDGHVMLGGVIASGTIGQSAFTLPTEARPTEKRFISTVSVSSGSKVFSEVEINTDGTVVPAVGGNTWFSLDNIRFSL